MKYPSWNEFAGKYPDNPQNAFEALCRFLFRSRYGIGDALPYFYNNAGNETVPIKVGNDTIGFQSKFFIGATIDNQQAGQIKHSIKVAHTHYPSQTKIIVYTNLSFGNPPEGKPITDRQKDIEDTAKENSLVIEWMFGENILDVVAKTPLAYNLFFDPTSNLSHLPSAVKKLNQLNLGIINTTIPYKVQEIAIDRSKELSDLKGLLAQKKNVLIHGESGSGKSAVVKKHWEEVANNGNIAYYFTRGEQFETHTVNSLFSMDEDYTYTGFREFYSGFDSKILIIDSAERLTELRNRTILQLILDGLGESGWQFVFTCKDNAYDELQKLLHELAVPVSDIHVERVSEDSLLEIGKKYQLSLPSNEKLFRQLRLPFYLARYCEVENAENATLEVFRDQVWNRKVRGTVKGGSQQKREMCLLTIVDEQQEKGSYYVTPAGLDYDAAYDLVQEEVLLEQPHKGYAVKHDIYVDWALDYIIERDFNKHNDFVSILKETPPSVTYRNAFRRWLENIVDSSDERVQTIIDAYITGEVQRQWEHTLLACVGSSKTYVHQFFSQYSEVLISDNYSLFERFVDVLTVSCLTVTQYFEYKGFKYPITKPKGTGWDESVEFVFANRDDYYMQHLGTVKKLLAGYSGRGKEATAMQEAAELSLYLFNEMASIRQEGGSIWADNLKEWGSLVCKYAYGIKQELNSIFNQVEENKWVKHTSPYSELVDYILKDSNHFDKTLFYVACQDSVIELMRLFWKEQPEDDDGRRWGNSRMHNQEYIFGLNTEYGMDMAYFPASPFQTPIKPLLEADALLNKNSNKVIDFIIDFMDYSVAVYAKRQNYEPLELVHVTMPNGEQHEVMLTQSLWNMYRGTANLAMPHVLESMHMALEKYLLTLAEDKQPQWDELKAALWRLLEKSHSASLYGIVASLAVAYPSKLYDILLFLCQDIKFLVADLNRYSHEITANSRGITFHRHENWGREREQSNKLMHRQEHLETRLFQVQCDCDMSERPEDKIRLEQAYKVVDAIKAQEAAMGKEDVTYQFVTKRVDYRSHHKRNVTLSNGIQAVELTPDLTPTLKAISDETSTYTDRMIAMSLRVWADKTFKGEEIKGSPFVDKPQYALEVIRKVEEQLETQNGNLMLMPSDEYVPYFASAVLLMKYAADLDQTEIKECWDRVMLALRNPAAMVSDSLSEFPICIASIPTMIDIYLEKQEEVKSIIARYVTETTEFVHQRVCDMMAKTILRGKLWEKCPEMMKDVLEKFQMEISGQDFDNMDAETADAVLCLLTCLPPKEFRKVGDICLGKLPAFWNEDTQYGRMAQNDHIAENVADYILNAPNEDVSKLINFYTPVLKLGSYSDSLMTQLLFGAAQNNKYDNFWKAWYAMYERVTSEARQAVLNEYLLNPSWLRQDYDDWFRLEEKDMKFFERVAKDIGGNPTVIFSLSRAFATIGKKMPRETLEVLYVIVKVHSPILRDEKKSVMFYMEKTLKLVLTEYGDEISRDVAFKTKVTTVLEYMITNGSSEAGNMIKIL